MATIVGTRGSDLVFHFGPLEFRLGWTVSPGVLGGPPTIGPDTILGGNGDDTLAGGLGGDEIHGGNGDDRLSASGLFSSTTGVEVDSGGNRLYGENGNDVLYAASDDDSLYGGNGDDTLFGDGDSHGASPGINGDDYLDGGRGNDLLVGRGGADTLLGGAGADTFRFTLLHGEFVTRPDTDSREGRRDVILDFEQGVDVLDLSGYHSRSAPPPVFLGSGAFGANGGLQVRYEIQDDRTVVQFIGTRNSGPGPEYPAGEIELVGVYALTAADVFLGTST